MKWGHSTVHLVSVTFNLASVHTIGSSFEGAIALSELYRYDHFLSLWASCHSRIFQSQIPQKCDWKSHFHIRKHLLVQLLGKSQTVSLVINLYFLPFFSWQEYPDEAEYTCITKTLEQQKELLKVGIKINK